MDRNDFIKYVVKTTALVLSGSQLSLAGSSSELFSQDIDEYIIERMVAANDDQVKKLLLNSHPGQLTASRQTGFAFAILASAYCFPGSAYYRDRSIIKALNQLIDILTLAQTKDGTLNFNNLASPPDTAFLLEPMIAGVKLLIQTKSGELEHTIDKTKGFILKGGDALVKGGVHTPNHRWLICGVLARLYELYPSPEYVDRIDDWLGEGVFIDRDGHYSERSINYAIVENAGLMTISRLINRPHLLDPVRKNLEMTWYYMNPDGSLITTDSRRQDQYKQKNIVSYYLLYRYLAIKDKNHHFAGIARLIEKMNDFNDLIADTYLFHFLDNRLLQDSIPGPVLPSTNYKKLFTTSHTLRIRKGNMAATVFGGIDWPLIITSGRSCSPNFFSFQKGRAVLKYVRLSADFFDTGYFYSDGIKKEGDEYVLFQRKEVPYYQPLPKNSRNPAGDYALTPSTDNRFWNKMDFQKRPRSNIKTLDTFVRVSEHDGVFSLDIQVIGQVGISVTVELCFNSGGKFTGVTDTTEGDRFLEKGRGVFEFEKETIHFGPGIKTHEVISGLEGEMYSSHFGSLKTEGDYVYLTGTTPFKHILTFN